MTSSGLAMKSQWWKPIEETFARVNLKGLTVRCPRCKEIGSVTTRWVKGSALKPIYVLHIKWGKARRVCELNREQSNRIRGRVPVFKSDLEQIMKFMKPFVLFSGGRDSLATLVYMNDLAKNVNCKMTAIYVDTTAGLPENTRYVRRVCRYLGIGLKVVRPKVDYFTLAKKWGIPGFRYRWCCRELKIRPIQEFLNSVTEPKVVFDGIRAVESNVRKRYIPVWYHPTFKCLSVSPIFYWSDEQLTSFINGNGIPRTLLHSLRTSTECWCGAYKTETDFRKLYELNKEIFCKLAEIEDETKNRYTFIYKNGQKMPLKDLEKQILKG